MIEQRVTLRYDAQQIPAIVQAVQGDTGRDVIFELADYEIPAGATANYYIDKPDDTAIYNSAEVISSTEIRAHLTEQALAVPGRNNGQVRILSDDEVITSFDFVLEVEAFRGILRLQSETEVNIFDEALQAAAEDAIEEIQAQTPVVTGMQNSIAPTYSSSSTYAVGDYVMYNAQLYRCTTAITTAEAWTAAHWVAIPLSDDVYQLNERISDVAGNSGLYLNTLRLPARNEVFSYDVNIAQGAITRKLYIKNNSSGAYYAYGLYNEGTLVWGDGVDVADSDLVWVDANSEKVVEIPLTVVADTFKIKNRNSKADTDVTIKSDIIVTNEYVKGISQTISELPYAVLSNIVKSYDGTIIYKYGDLVLYNGKIYICTVGYESASETFQTGAFKEITTNELYVILKSLLFTSENPWEQGSISYSTGETVASTTRTRTTEISNIAVVESEFQSFGVLGYYDGEYLGMYDSSLDDFVIPTDSAILTKYADLSKYGIGYTFRLINYSTGDVTVSSRLIGITGQKYISIANIDLLRSVVNIADSIPTETIIEVGTGKTYTSLRTALEYASTIASKHNIVTVQFYGNGVTYDVMNDITSADLETTSTWPGLSVPAYTRLVGMGSREQNVISLELPNGTDASTIFRISTINLYENAELENLWIIGKNCRYACHDDMMSYDPEWKLKTVKNCRFTSNYTDQHRAYGAGYRSGVNWRFENCIFENINGEAEEFGNAAFSAHNNNAMKKSASITFINCQFYGGHGVGFSSLNNTSGQNYANAKTNISFYGCKAIAKMWDYPVIASLPTSTIPNAVLEICITGYANNFGPGDVKVYSNAASAFVDTFNDQITVWGKITDDTWGN